MKNMDFHPSQLPVVQSFEIDDERKAADLAGQMVKLGFALQKGAFKVIMPKDQKVAKKIGFTILYELYMGLKKQNKKWMSNIGDIFTIPIIMQWF